MSNENNKMQVDIDTLKKQNVNDLLSIKELYKRIEELDEKTTQVKYIDNTLVKKLKKEYGNFKKIILNENIQVKLTNDIETINSQQVKLTNNIGSINSQLETNTNELKKIKTFKIFPSDEELNNLNLNETFEVKGFYNEGDINKCLYKKVSYSQNAIQKTGFCIKPITNCSNKKIYLPFIGIKEGKENSEQNSTILSNLSLAFGTTLELPDGHFYFKNTIDLKSKQCSLKGNYITFTPDLNTGGITFLHFEELEEGEKAITLATGGLSNIVVVGNKEYYNYNINREQTYINPQSIENEICNKKITGIYGGSTTILENVYVKNFYNGCYLESGNIYGTNLYCRNCHIGISVGSDTKLKGIYGWNVHTVLEIRSNISSAIQVRGDSIHHLVHLNGSSCNGIYLCDLDGDYCLGSILKIGTKGKWHSTKGLVVSGITGRHGVLKCYDKTKDEIITSNSILTSDEIDSYSFISIMPQNHLYCATFILNGGISSNPLDKSSNYLTPEVLFGIGENCNVHGITVITNFKTSNSNEKFTKDIFKNLIKSFSIVANNTNIALITSKGNFYYNKNSSNITTTKTTIENLE